MRDLEAFDYAGSEVTSGWIETEARVTLHTFVQRTKCANLCPPRGIILHNIEAQVHVLMLQPTSNWFSLFCISGCHLVDIMSQLGCLLYFGANV